MYSVINNSSLTPDQYILQHQHEAPLSRSANLFPVIGIGASAGGLEAFKTFIRAIPEDSGMAYVLVQHLDPKHNSQLPSLLQKVSKVPVVEITDDIKVKPDHIYIIPSNKMLIANDGVLQLSTRKDVKNQRHLPIDVFFSSLAEVHQAHAIGVVLSGTMKDGTEGLKAIKAKGGITFAQDKLSAAYDGMPQSAALAGVVDFILDPGKIPARIMELTKGVSLEGADDHYLLHQEEAVYKQILDLLRLRKGTDFTYYKQATIYRRTQRRMLRNNIASVDAYLKFLRENEHEQDILYSDLLIPVTSFFRDAKTFDNLCSTVLPMILQNKTGTEPIRVWVAGCSTGQEPYSLAICLKEFLAEKPGLALHPRVQIFATDMSEPAITRARSGIYTTAETAGISPMRLQTFFSKTAGGHQVSKAIRDMCVFASHNFLQDPPFSKMDFVTCRNVLIYMEPYLQKKALTNFHYALNKDGFMLLGKSETINAAPELFTLADKKDRLFKRKDVPGKFIHSTSLPTEKNVKARILKGEKIDTDFQQAANDAILGKNVTAGVVVNEDLDIMHFRGSTGQYLEAAPGKPSLNILKMAKEGLPSEIRNLVHKARTEQRAVIKENIQVMSNGLTRLISIEATPLLNIIEPHYLILFHDQHPVAKKTTIVKNGSKEVQGEKDRRILQLEQELKQSREDMTSIAEEQEAVNEELQSANEELLSGSEELQSLNEELETSKEELQSTNEELIVVNQEMGSLIEQVTEARDFAESVIRTMREPLLVLDEHLIVLSANKAFYKMFRVNELQTEGVLIFDLGNKQWNIPSLRALLEDIIPNRSEFSDFEVELDFPGIGKRVLLLNGSKMRREQTGEKLILLAIDDITERKTEQLKGQELLSRFQKLVMRSPVAMCILKGNEFTVELANDYFLQLFDKSKAIVDKPLFYSFPELIEQGIGQLIREVMQTSTPYVGNERELYMQRGGEKRQGFFNFVYQPVQEQDKPVDAIMVVVTEVTDLVISRKRMEAQAMMVKSILMTAPGFICTLAGPLHVYDLVNEQYQLLFGKREIKGKPMLEALPELAGQGFDVLLDKVYETGEPYVGIDIPILTARDIGLEPEVRYFNFSYQRIEDGNPTNTILVFGYEVTAQVNAKNKILEIQQLHSKELEAKVQQRTIELTQAKENVESKNETLVKLNKELEAFSYVSSHDLQEPLRKIKTFANLLVERESSRLSDSGKDFISRIQHASIRMQTLIEDLISYSRVNITERVFVLTDIGALINEVVGELADSIAEKNAVVVVNSKGHLNIQPSQFRQLLHNLIGNALKFSRPGVAPQISIHSKIDQGAAFKKEELVPVKNYCHLSVMDNGIGIEAQYRERIFEVFQRLHGKDEYEGTGIGLAIVKKIVENHHGFISALGIPGKGSRFDIYIPVT